MTIDDAVSRRRLLQLGGLTAGGVVAGSLAPLLGAGTAQAQGVVPLGAPPSTRSAASIPVAEIERIIRAKGTVSNGVLNIEIDRTDLPGVVKLPSRVPIKPGFEINGNLVFQSGDDGGVVFNGDLGFLPDEVNPAIDQMLAHDIDFQAFHQHLFNLEPMVYFMHMFAAGDARRIATGLAAVLAATATPLPQAPPVSPTTPFDVGRLDGIIGGKGTIGSDGVVSYELPRRGQIVLHGVPVNPYLNVYTTVGFQPLGSGGPQAVAVPDFGMTAAEIAPLMTTMRQQDWQVNCLYNQETAEDPQLYFSHHYKTGDAYQLAQEIRRGLDLLDLQLT